MKSGSSGGWGGGGAGGFPRPPLGVSRSNPPPCPPGPFLRPPLPRSTLQCPAGGGSLSAPCGLPGAPQPAPSFQTPFWARPPPTRITQIRPPARTGPSSRAAARARPTSVPATEPAKGHIRGSGRGMEPWALCKVRPVAYGNGRWRNTGGGGGGGCSVTGPVALSPIKMRQRERDCHTAPPPLLAWGLHPDVDR